MCQSMAILGILSSILYSLLLFSSVKVMQFSKVEGQQRFGMRGGIADCRKLWFLRGRIRIKIFTLMRGQD